MNCVVCLEPLIGAAASPGCQHVYHAACLRRWRNAFQEPDLLDDEDEEAVPVNLLCPSCRFPIPEEFLISRVVDGEAEHLGTPSQLVARLEEAEGRIQELEQELREQKAAETDRVPAENVAEIAMVEHLGSGAENLDREVVGQLQEAEPEAESQWEEDVDQPILHGAPMFGQWMPPRNCFVCGICGRTFTNTGTKSTHLRSHDGTKFECETCGRIFPNRSNLSRHCRSHQHVPVPR
ncbi:Neurotrophin receptor-interacting factor 2 [Orchesella cincta]|uniref:Neurotrophin receptor-interacting factor 2 n=1 Tax=Orchesella cincta TaxID=48709 RepID=A0A1D2M0F8_ORCCI|nr:Neurotrophin receptor-interacting factor 2 [Orchesella cincta]